MASRKISYKSEDKQLNMAIDILLSGINELDSIKSSLSSISKLDLVISDPPTKVEVETIMNKLNEILNKF